MSTKKTTTTTSNQTQKSAPPAWTLPGLENAGAATTAALKESAAVPHYMGDFTAAPDLARTQAQMAQYDAASGRATGLADFVQQKTMGMFGGEGDNGLNAAIQSAIHPVFRQLQEQILPGITNSALMSGAYSNDRALGVVPEQAIRESNANAQRIAATMGYEGFQAEQNRNMERMSMLPGLTSQIGQLSAGAGDLTGMGTGLDQALRQALISNAMQKQQYAVEAPYQGLPMAAQLLAQLSGGYGTQTSNGTEKQVSKTSGLGPILQGAMGLASMAGGLGAFGGLGGGAGALGGAAGSAGGAINNWASILPKVNAASIFQGAGGRG